MKFVLPEEWFYEKIGDKRVKLTWLLKKKIKVIEKTKKEVYDMIQVTEGTIDEKDIEVILMKLLFDGTVNKEILEAIDRLKNVSEKVIDDKGNVEVCIKENDNQSNTIGHAIVIIDNFLEGQEENDQPLVNQIFGNDIDVKELHDRLEKKSDEERKTAFIYLGMNKERCENNILGFLTNECHICIKGEEVAKDLTEIFLIECISSIFSDANLANILKNIFCSKDFIDLIPNSCYMLDEKNGEVCIAEEIKNHHGKLKDYKSFRELLPNEEPCKECVNNQLKCNYRRDMGRCAMEKKEFEKVIEKLETNKVICKSDKGAYKIMF